MLPPAPFCGAQIDDGLPVDERRAVIALIVAAPHLGLPEKLAVGQADADEAAAVGRRDDLFHSVGRHERGGTIWVPAPDHFHLISPSARSYAVKAER